MPERLDRLREALRELEAELGKVDLDDAKTQQLLTEAKREIETALAKADHPNDLEEAHSFAERLTEAELQFAASHPTLSGVVRRLIDVLAQMGI